MASNDYFYDPQRPGAHSGPAPSPAPQPYYSQAPAFTPSPQTTPAPSYHQAGYGAPDAQTAPGGGKPGTGPSPFDTVFDDNAYPYNSRDNTPNPSHGDISQQQPYYDTAYRGAGAPQHYGNDIPLEDRNKDSESNDHIHDAPERKRSRRRRKVRVGELGMTGADRKRVPWVVYFLTIAQVAVFIYEIVRNGMLTGSPIMIKPQFNPMIGPSTQVLINMGARYSPCMHNLKELQGNKTETYFLCPNATKYTDVCPLNELCGFGGKTPNPLFNGDVDQSPEPDQWYRFIIPVFMHAGLIHIGFNMLLQMTLGKEMEMAIGPIRFFLVYISAGIFGNVMGGNYAAPGIASTGASGALFGIIALTLLDLIYSWKDRRNPVKDLMFILLDMIISFGLGLLPGLDNFAHIGGFLMGLALGVCVLHSPNSLRRRIDGNDVPYSAVHAGEDVGPPPFLKSPLGFFKGRKGLWWAWWLVRAAFLIMIIVVFIVLLNNFYTSHTTCSWCKYLSCIPVKDWCDIGQIDKGS